MYLVELSLTLKDLVSENRQELLNNEEELEKTEMRLEERYLQNN